MSSLLHTRMLFVIVVNGNASQVTEWKWPHPVCELKANISTHKSCLKEYVP